MTRKSAFLVIILLIIHNFTVYSENIRGPVKGVSVIDLPNSNIEEIDLLAEDLFALTLKTPDNLPVKTTIEIRSPDKVKEYRDTFSIFFYNKITPSPAADNSSYKGSIVDYKIIPARARHFIELHYTSIPKTNEILPGTDIINQQKFRSGNLPLIFTILPVMKGVPDFLLKEYFKIKITHYWPDRGELQLNVFEKSLESLNSGQDLTEISDYDLTVDGVKYDQKDFPLQLNTGIRKIKIEKEGFMPFEQSIIINKNEKSELDLILTDRIPYLRIFSPKEAEIFINGSLTDKREFTDLHEGQYTIVFKLGDYSLSRKITLENGKRYNLNMLLEIELKEE